MRRKHCAVDALSEELQRLIEHHVAEWHLSLAEVVGVLHVKAFELMRQVVDERKEK
jgi:hypothetical protein